MIYHKFQKHRKKWFALSVFVWMFFSANLLYDSIPNEIYRIKGDEGEIRVSLPVAVERKEEESVPALNHVSGRLSGTEISQDYRLSCKFLNLIPVKEVTVHVVEKSYVAPSGMPIGIYAKTKGVLVIGTGKVTARDGLNYEPADQIVKGGDYIVSANGAEISDKEDLVDQVNASLGNAVVLTVLREGDLIDVKIQPVALEDGSYKLGVWVRDDMAGVGTLTYVKNSLEFGALGHPVSDADTGSMIELADGKVYHTDIVGIVKGENGSPGELTGVINYKDENCLGSIAQNTKTGIYGTLSKFPEGTEETYLEVGYKQDIEKGGAYILSSLDGTLRRYQIEIDEVDYSDKEENKGILFHVTDDALLSQTGGIVQGMSGSPILQGDKVIGAVTHVFISDATKGYGVFIEKMLEH